MLLVKAKLHWSSAIDAVHGCAGKMVVLNLCMIWITFHDPGFSTPASAEYHTGSSSNSDTIGDVFQRYPNRKTNTDANWHSYTKPAAYLAVSVCLFFHWIIASTT